MGNRWGNSGNSVRLYLFVLQGNLPNPGMEPRSPALQVDSLSSELPEKPILVVSLGLIPRSRIVQGFPGGASGKEPTCQCRRCKRLGFNPGVGKIVWRRAWQLTLVFLPGESHGQRSLVGYSPWGHTESVTTEQGADRH